MLALDRIVVASVLVLAACGARRHDAPILEATTSRAVAEEGDDPTRVAPDAVSTPALGAREPRAIVTLWLDYQCPFCRRQHDVAARVLDFWGDAVQVQFRMVPAPAHAMARPAAVVALAAHRQERFACMNTALIRTRATWQRSVSADALYAWAGAELAPHCGLDAARFAEDVRDPRLAAKVESDYQLAASVDVPATPAVQVDGLFAAFWPNPSTRPAMLLSAMVRRSLREAEATCGAQCDWRALLSDRIYGNTGDIDVTMRLLDGQ